MNRKKLFRTVLCLIIGLVMVSCGGGNNPADIEMSIMKQYQKGNYEKAIEIWVENVQWEEDANIKELKDQMKSLAPKMRQQDQSKDGIKEIKLIEEEIEGDEAYVTTLVIYNNGDEDENETDYVKVNNQWKIKKPRNK